MISYTMPLPVRELLDGYKSAISNDTNPSWLGYGALVAGFTFASPSLSNIVRTFAWSPSVSTLQRATSSFDTIKFMKRLRSKILAYILKILKVKNLCDFCIAIDDTPIEKFSKDLPGFGMIVKCRFM